MEPRGCGGRQKGTQEGTHKGTQNGTQKGTKPAKFEARTHAAKGIVYGFTCSTCGHKHTNQHINAHGVLTNVPINSWMPFLNMMNYLRLAKTWGDMTSEIASGYGNIHHSAFERWCSIYQAALGSALQVTENQVFNRMGGMRTEKLSKV